jgi:hypothetical protein
VWDVILFGAALAYLATAYMGKPRQMWRLISQGGVVGTVLVNATAAHDARTLVVHLTGPIAWAVLVEAGASQLRADYRSRNREALGETIPLRLWLWSPRESARTWLRMARRLDGEQQAARLDVGLHQAAVEALRVAAPGRAGRRVRGIVRRQLLAGSLAPEAVLGACGWLDLDESPDPAQRVLRAALGAALGRVQDDGEGTGNGESVAGPVAVEVVDPESVSGPVLAPEPRPLPVAAARHERPSAVTVRASEDTPDADPLSDDPVLLAAHAVAIDLARQEKRLTRDALVAGLRDRGHSCSNGKAGDLLRLLRTDRSA